MKKREMIAWGLVVLLAAIFASYYYVGKGKAEVRAQEVAKLRTEKESLDRRVDEIKKQNEKLTLNVADLNDWLKDADSVIAELKARPEPRPVEVVRWKRLPADCQSCMRNNSLPVTVVDDKAWVETQVRDAFHPEDGASIKLLPAFDRDILAPARKALKDCEDTLGDCQGLLDEATKPPEVKPEPPISFDSSHGVFVGAGYIGRDQDGKDNLGVGLNYSGRFIRLGSRDGLNVELGINVGGVTPFDGRNIEVYGLGGGEIKW